MTQFSPKFPFVMGLDPLTIEDLVSLACQGRPFRLSEDPEFKGRIDKCADYLAGLLEAGENIYGVNTGYGDSCTTIIPPELVQELPLHLCRYHGCGLGQFLNECETRAVMVARLCSLSRGYSGVRWELLKAIEALIQHDILPRIPSEGSVGASGDLTPLSYLAAVLMGEREVLYQGRVCPAMEALQAAKLSPIKLAPKEALALMNGTAVMTGLACLAHHRAKYLSQLSTRLTSLCAASLHSNRDHFHPRLFELKAHPGQSLAAKRIYEDLGGQSDPDSLRIQDRYSIRCAPHVIGVLEDCLAWSREWIERELNSANDNPLFDPEMEMLFHGGHFYGGHIAFAMDGLKTAIANVADLMDRQLALLVDARYNQGLPANLSGSLGQRAAINHGLKAAQISSSALTAESLKLCMPASVFSRSTECHNQDKVSMGTIASRDCLRVLELTERVQSILCVATRQALGIRQRQGEAAQARLCEKAFTFLQSLIQQIPLIEEDRALDGQLNELTRRIQTQSWDLY